jgi:hypothetical protein
MTEDLAYHIQLRALADRVGGKGVAHRMDGGALDAGLL